MSVPDIPPTTDSPAVAAAKEVEAIAEQYRDAIATLRGIMPLLQFDTRQTKRVAASAKFAPGLIAPVIAMVTSDSWTRGRNMFNVNDGQYALQLQNQIAPLMQQLASIAADGLFTIDSKLAVSSVQALQTYKWAERAAVQPNGAGLHPFVAEIGRVVMKVLNRRRRRAPIPPPTPDPTPAPETIADTFDRLLDEAAQE